MPSPERVDGFPVVPLVRAIADAARRFRSGHDVATLVAEALQRGQVTLDALRDELEAGPVQGSAHLRDAVTLLANGALSPPEGHLGRLLESAGIPHVVLNARLVTSSGRFVAVADAWLDDVGLAIEVDSVEHHAGPDGFAMTVQRNRRYAEAGVPVLPLLPRDLRDPERTLGQIHRARRSAASRPRPNVAMVGEAQPVAGREGWRWGT